jgi:hypothetical protein
LALFASSVPLFFAAAWIESFVRESALGTTARFSVAAAGALVLFAIGLVIRRFRGDVSRAPDWLDELIEARQPTP